MFWPSVMFSIPILCFFGCFFVGQYSNVGVFTVAK